VTNLKVLEVAQYIFVKILLSKCKHTVPAVGVIERRKLVFVTFLHMDNILSKQHLISRRQDVLRVSRWRWFLVSYQV
jgi:hypothetical protein